MSSTQGTPPAGPPPIDPALLKQLEIQPTDDENTKAYKLKMLASIENQYVQGWLNAIRTASGGARAIGGPV